MRCQAQNALSLSPPPGICSPPSHFFLLQQFGLSMILMTIITMTLMTIITLVMMTIITMLKLSNYRFPPFSTWSSGFGTTLSPWRRSQSMDQKTKTILIIYRIQAVSIYSISILQIQAAGYIGTFHHLQWSDRQAGGQLCHLCRAQVFVLLEVPFKLNELLHRESNPQFLLALVIVGVVIWVNFKKDVITEH